MIKATFDAPTLADAIAKAARVAPSKGAAYDRAAGILIEVDPAGSLAVVKSTNLDLTFSQQVTVQDGKGSMTKWRIPSGLLSGLLSNLPMGTGATVTFHDKGDNAIRITSGTTAAKINTLPPEEFPPLPEVDRSTLSDSQDFSTRVAQVSWACAKDNSILSGVHIDGESLIGCDRNSAALIPCRVPITQPITVPLFLLSPVLRAATDVRVGATDRHFLIALDAESDATGRIMEGEYPSVKNLLRENFTGYAEVNRTQFNEVVNRMMVMARAERLPSMSMEFRTGLVRQLVLDMEVPDTGRIQDRMDIGGEFDDDFTINVTPQYILSAIDNARGDTAKLHFGNSDDPTKSAISSIMITTDDGYQALVMPRRKT